ncbi:hypothetical protein GR160_14035 [Flavobacterium sp. Sd200]|uniref:hypothetical protein n=1 Tax=Flavobacterium sp. Sd200 TaxID=2692211 RepID=UPI00136F81D7|nr:hypothetical protein [Flavobacterium sp. Sd200]MXN92344.1 hypothetical protein [Flavobacterium sp. Sd200]
MKYFYVLLLFVVLCSVNAQSPGGIDGYSIWLKATDLVAQEKSIENNFDNIDKQYFNFNKILSHNDLKKTNYKNIVEDKYSFFCVFKSEIDQEEIAFTITKGKSETFISNKQLKNEEEIAYKKVDAKNGIIISYISALNKKGKKNNHITIDDLYIDDKLGQRQLLEVIYYPRLLNANERQSIETYLSLKYGISVLGEFNYLSTAKDTIWNYKKNKIFSNRVTGIGRDNDMSLYQKQSGNAEKDGLYIGFGTIDTTNAKNKYDVRNQLFYVWGDNLGDINFKKNKNSDDIKIIKRLWKMQCTNQNIFDTISTQVRIGKKELGLTQESDTESFWLAINDINGRTFDYTAARYIKQTFEDNDYIYFDKVYWDKDNSGSDIFTFIKGPDFFFNNENVADCSKTSSGSIKLSVAGGESPYQITLKSKNTNKEQIIKDGSFEFSGLEYGKYILTVTDAKKNTKTTNIDLEPFTDKDISIAPIWYMGNDKETLVTASISNNDFSYQWLSHDQIVSTSEIFTATQPGEYYLKVVNANGCEKKMPFTVVKTALNSGWTVYSNPSKNSLPFNVDFKLSKESSVVLKINSMEGKSYLVKDLGRIKDYTYTESLSTAGIYLITAVIDGKEESVKLIIE